jgi:N-formylglutamate amidohydrolase
MQTRRRSLCLVAFLIIVPVAFAQEATPKPESFTPGQSYFGVDNHIEYIAGDLPFILSAPHGGREKPEGIPDRKEGTFAFDVGTQELARAIAKEIHDQTGHCPHIIICRISRRKIDCNREIVEACAGNQDAEAIWHDWHRFIGAARERVIKEFGRGLYIDLHGHGHKIAQLEMGYLHTPQDYALTDAELSQPNNVAKSSLQGIAILNRRPLADVIRGDFALGTLLMARGFPATPSKERPTPVAPYFTGGYNTVRYGREGAPIAGLQIETNSKGVRDNDTSRAKFAKALTESLKIYLPAHLGIELAPKPNIPPRQLSATARTSPTGQPCLTATTCCPPPCCRRRQRCRR